LNLKAMGKLATVENMLATTTVFTEVLRAYPWLMFASSLSLPGWTHAPLSLWSALVILGVIVFLVKMTLNRGLHISEARVTTLGISILLILLFLRLENGGGYAPWDPAWVTYAGGHALSLIAGLSFGLFLLWRGITTGREDLRTDYLYRNFVIGIVSFILLMFVWAASLGLSAGRQVFATLVPYVLAYFFAALTGLGVSNFLSLREGMGARPKATDLFARRWLILLLSVVLVIVIVGSAVATGVSTDVLASTLRPLNTAAGWLARGLMYLLSYLGYIVFAVYWAASFIVNWLRGLAGPLPQQPTPSTPGDDLIQKIQNANTSEGFLLVLKWVVFVAAVATVLFLLWRALYRYWRGPQDKGYEEINESLWGNFGADMRSLLKGLADRFRVRRGAHAAPPPAVTMTDDSQFINVRELYRGLLWVAAETGHPKVGAQTAFEYGDVLKWSLAKERKDLSELTDAYVRERYGHVIVDREHGAALARLWLRLRAALRGLEEP